jgi:aminoglycoside phosphotransferase family enzyme/predicted kinase
MPDPGAKWESMAAFLADPATHGGAGTQRIDTHTAAVVVAGDRAWKLRRPVNYGWLDYGTLARRRECAEREIALNSPTAPGLYLGLAGIVPDGGGWRLVGPGDLPKDAEPVVVMQRFRQEDLFDRMAADGRLTPELMRATGRAVADMHKAAPAREGMGRLPAFAGRETNELMQLADLLGQEAVTVFSASVQDRAEAGADLAEQRGARRCHGDLHLRNIVLWQGRPAPFDCIDFNDAFTDIDPLYDLAFLLMDLDHRGHGELAVEVFNDWAERMAAEPGARLGTGVETAYGGLALLPLFKACRAGIRAKVGALALRGHDLTARGAELSEARAYLALATRYLTHAPPARLIAVGGLSGSGKSTLAWALARRLGAVVLRSDAIRKGFRGIEQTEKLPGEAYAPEVTARVYSTMLERAGMALAGGATVILDAAHLKVAERDRAEALATTTGVPFAGLWLDAPVAQLKARVTARKADASDADAGVVEKQTGYDLGPIRWQRLATESNPEAVVDMAMAALDG